MCGILGYKNTTPNEQYVKLRGQDDNNTLEKGGFTFKHFLLSITGEHTLQPYVKDNIVMLYNGEIYNREFERSDGEVIIPLYEKLGCRFPRELDGEFAIALFDFGRKHVLFATDSFGTKPLWINDELEFSSYESGVTNGKKVLPNTTMLFKLDGTPLTQLHTTMFDFDHQHKTTYDDWITAFKNAVKKRAVPNCFLGLSSGYDSGGIACELNNLGVKYSAYTINKGENQTVMTARNNLTPKHEYLTTEPRSEIISYLATNVERYKYDIKYDGKETNMTIHDDPASIGLSRICEEAKKHDQKVYLSGQGADEVMSDYSPWPMQSSLKGHYPKELTPWYNFHQGCQSSYIAKEEYVAGSHNIEARYPYLDKAVVQEFLWLTQELKNNIYKAPLTKYLEREGYPFAKGEKLGFTT